MLQEITFDSGNHVPVSPNIANELPLIVPEDDKHVKSVSSRLHRNCPSGARYMPEGKDNPVGDAVGLWKGDPAMTLQEWNQSKRVNSLYES